LIGPAIQFKPVKGDAALADSDLRDEWPDRSIEQVFVHP
jgi:hypothetical protein